MSNSVRFRVRAPNGGQYTLDPMPTSSTMHQLQSTIIKELNLVNTQPACIQIKFIFPPPQIISEVAPNTTLSSLKLTSGNLIISILDLPPAIAQNQEESNEEKQQNISKEEKTSNHHQNSNDGTMQIKVIDSDNSCLFNAVLFVAEEGTMDKMKSAELREIIASIVMSDPITYNKALLAKANGEYIEYIMKSDTWGGYIELAVLSTYYQLQINAIDVVTLNVHRFGEDCNFKQCVYVIYDGIHYDALIMKLQNESIRHRFATSNDSVFAQALSIAAELNSRKQFTDVYNFGLICNVCNAKLKGQNEAQKHAEMSGHQQFSQYQ